MSTQCDTTDLDENEIPIPDTPELEKSGEWKVVGTRKVWKRNWSSVGTETMPRGQASNSSKKRKRRRVRRSNNSPATSDFVSSPPHSFEGNTGVWSQGPPAMRNSVNSPPHSFGGNMGVWGQGPPAAVFQPSNFDNRPYLRGGRKSIKISGLPVETTEFSLSTYICNAFNMQDVTVKNLTPQNLRYPANYVSFKVTVPENCAHVLFNHRQWGLSTRVSEFREGPTHPLGFRSRSFNNRH